jgi:ribonuclease R
MSYTDVNKIIEEQDSETSKRYEELLPMFYTMKELADILRERRSARGSIDFDFPESKITLDEKGYPIEIQPYERMSANKLIEDFMLLANETVAEDYFWQELPFVYRTHEAPDPERIQKLSVLISNFGHYFKTNPDTIHPKEFQKLLSKIEGTPEEAMISRLTLRSMKQAKYTTVCSGHFGLSTQYYCHFTSPIRRYPDLQIHRIIKENLHGGLQEKRIAHYERILEKVTQDCSKLERRAEEAEREVEKLKKVEYMHQHIGEYYEGVISGINAWGMYVELPNTVEGMVHVTNLLDDYYFYDEEKYAMIGKETGKVYTLGQKVRIRVKDTDRMMKTIDFVIAD